MPKQTMTRLSFAISILLSLEGQAHASTSSTNVPSYTPKRIAYSALKSITGSEDEPAFLDPLVTDGLISVTDIPGFSSLKEDTLTWLHACIMDQGDADAAHHTYDDGTIRRTIAGVTVPGGANQAGVPQPLQVNPEGDRLSSVSSHACDEFSKNLDAFRSAVASITSLFAERLSNEFEPSLDQTSPLMSTEDGSHTFDNIESLVKEGNHLEHFHSYQKPMNSSPKQSPPEDTSTIDLHTDQGFFIVLTPGMIVKHNSLKEDGEDSTLVPDLSTPSELSGGFYIETADGVIAQTQFEEQDELIFMLGDGVNQYVNTKVVPSMPSKKLRATPHSVSLSSFGNDSARVWYGRMVLPPVRGYSEEHQMTYGEIRSNLRKPQQSKTEMTIAHTLGCSSNEAFARQLEGGEFDCDNGGVWCWHRCMTPEPYGFTKQDCDDQDLLMQCINPRGQLYPGGYKHGDYYPACTNTTDEETDPPQIAARDEDETCTLAAFEAFTNPSEYDHGMNLTTEETSAHFLWSVTSAGKIKGRLTFNGKFGYLALGFPGPNPTTTRKKGMHESKFFMGTPGGNYDESTIGLDLSVGTIVKEYTLAPKTVGSSFRHWDESATDVNPMNQASITEHDCFTSLEFEADCIKDVTFNTTGTDILLWAANGQDTYAGYHGKHRAQFIVEWKTGRSNFTHILENDDNGDGVECLDKVLDCDNKDSAGSPKLSTWPSCAFTLMGLISAFVFM